MEDNLEKEISPAVIGGRSSIRRLGVVVAGIGLCSALVYLLSKVLGGRGVLDDEPSVAQHPSANVVDDQGTSQDKAARILRNLRDRAFEADDEKLALALGRPVEEVVAWNAGVEVIDDDVVMKARGIAMNRGVHVE